MGAWNGSLEDMVTKPDFWAGRRVFITGHTGFKGAWLSLLLRRLGADVFGYALEPQSERDLFVVADVQRDVTHRTGDIRDLPLLRKIVGEVRPSIVIHMAAQALVRRSYEDPIKTYSTNVMGTVNVLEAIRQVSGIEAAVIVTSDKCYENLEHGAAYKETDRLGGRDPYSNSKGCAELVTASYRSSFFSKANSPRIATARAGNVIGGGDWAEDRLVPDAVRAFLSGETLRIRNPHAIRPWQHVIDPVMGYLMLAEQLVAGTEDIASGWNFGPSEASEVSVATLADKFVGYWGDTARWEWDRREQPHEAHYLTLDSSKARERLGWRPLLTIDAALELTAEWYRSYSRGGDMRQVSHVQLEQMLSSFIAPKSGGAV